MVQILYKMVHLQYPINILEIWCCHKHINQLPPSRLKFDTKLRKVFPNNLAAYIALHKSFLQGKYCTQFCLFVLANIKCKHVKLRFLATFGTCYSSQMPSSRLKCGKKLRNTSPSRFVSTALHKLLTFTGKIRRVLYVNFECLFWPIKSMHSKPGF